MGFNGFRLPQEKWTCIRLRTDDGFAARFYRALAVFLSARLRSTVATLGYGDASADDEASAEEMFEDGHMLDESLFDTPMLPETACAASSTF